MTAIEIIDAEVRDVVRREGIDPVADPGAIRTIVEKVVAELRRAQPEPTRCRRWAIRVGQPRTVLDAVAGFGPLQRLSRRPDRRGDLDQRTRAGSSSPARPHELTTTVLTEEEIRDLVERMLKSTGPADRRVPAVHRRAAAGRQPPACGHPRHHCRHCAVNIRKFIVRANHLDELVALGTLTPPRPRSWTRCAWRAQRPRGRRHPSRQDHDAQLPDRRRPGPRAGDHLRRGLRAQGADARCGANADQATEPGRSRRDQPPPSRPGGPADAPAADCGR